MNSVLSKKKKGGSFDPRYKGGCHGPPHHRSHIQLDIINSYTGKCLRSRALYLYLRRWCPRRRPRRRSSRRRNHRRGRIRPQQHAHHTGTRNRGHHTRQERAKGHIGNVLVARRGHLCHQPDLRPQGPEVAEATECVGGDDARAVREAKVVVVVL